MVQLDYRWWLKDLYKTPFTSECPNRHHQVESQSDPPAALLAGPTRFWFGLKPAEPLHCFQAGEKVLKETLGLHQLQLILSAATMLCIM